MEQEKSKKGIIIGAIAIGIAIAVFFGWNSMNKEVEDVSSLKVEKVYSAAELFELANAESGLNDKIGKTVAIGATVQEIKIDEKQITLVLGDDAMNTIVSQVDERYLTSFNKLTAGEIVQLKGKLTGVDSDELMGSSIQMKNCVLNK